MKQLILTFSALFIVLFTFNSCKKDQIHVNELSGRWMVKSKAAPEAVDGLAYYTFNDNGSYTLEVIDYLEDNSGTYPGTYKLTDNNTIITLYRDDMELIKNKILIFNKNYIKWTWLDEQNKTSEYTELNKMN